jgi:hypothetical protein
VSASRWAGTGRRIVPLALSLMSVAALCIGPGAVAGAADGVPSGERILGQSVIEPVYDADHAGVIGFISTPSHVTVHADARVAKPIYLPVYPTGSTVGALVCPHLPVDTCPDHGPGIAGLAASTQPAVYGDGVAGHDHLAAFRNGDFGVMLEPIVVLFTTKSAAEEHLLTAAAIAAAVQRGDAILIPLPSATLHGALVPAKVWKLATPIVE